MSNKSNGSLSFVSRTLYYEFHQLPKALEDRCKNLISHFVADMCWDPGRSRRVSAEQEQAPDYFCSSFLALG